MAINEFKSSKTYGKSCSKTQAPSKRKSGLQTQLYQLSGIENQQGFLEVSFKVPPTPSPSPKLTRRFSISPTRTFTSSRLGQDPEKFNYEVISIKEEERDDSEDEGNEISNHCRESGFSRQKSDKDASLGLLKRKCSLKIQAEVFDLEDRELMPRFMFKLTNSRFCDRAIYLKNSDLPKHFCDILGPGMCADCMKARKQQANVNDFVESFPDISVSPYQLCVPPENDSRKSKTPTQVYKDCDVLLRKRSMSRFSAPDGRTTGTPARPNSSVGQNDSLRSLGSSPVLSYMSGHSRGLSAYSNKLSVSSPEPDSRRTSIARYIDNTLQESEKPHGWKNRKLPRSAVKARGPKPKFERQHSDLHQNVFHKAISARMSGTRSSRIPAIERRGKLSEVSYWRFLIPEPPVMEVGRMNVSIYTPKDLPGIKIFDESLFDI